MAENTLFSSGNNKENKGALLNKIVTDLKKSCESILAVIIADWQGFSFASSLPSDVNEEEISATTLFTLEGAEGTRKELEKSLLGGKLSYLILVTERLKQPAYMVIFPIEELGYIASISHTREDMGVIIQNMKAATNKAFQILSSTEKRDSLHDDSVEQMIAPKYDQLMKKLEALKNVRLPFLESSPQPAPAAQSTPVYENTYIPSLTDLPILEPPPVEGPPAPPESPLDFIEVQTEIDDLEPEIIVGPPPKKYQVTFKDAKQIKYTVVLTAQNDLDAEIRIKDREQFQNVEIVDITEVED